MSKWKKRIKKALKTAGKAAALGATAYLGAKALGGRKGTASPNPIGGVDEIVRKKAARDKAIDAGVLANVHDSESDMYTPKKHIVNRTRNKIIYSDGSVETPGTIYQKNKLRAGNKIPPSMRGGAKRAEGYQPISPPNMSIYQSALYGLKKGGRVAAKKGGSVKKAKVTGIAKRGFGRALMKGKK